MRGARWSKVLTLLWRQHWLRRRLSGPGLLVMQSRLADGTLVTRLAYLHSEDAAKILPVPGVTSMTGDSQRGGGRRAA